MCSEDRSLYIVSMIIKLLSSSIDLTMQYS